MALVFLFAVSPFVNEKIVACLLPCFYYRYRSSKEPAFFKHFFLPVLVGIIYFYLCSKWLRVIVGVDIGWQPSWENLIINIVRPRAWISAVLTIGPQIVAVAYFHKLIDRKSIEIQSLILGVLLFFLIWSYSFIAAWTDGRFLWYSYPYFFNLIRLACLSKQNYSIPLN